jgi:hypothetical protein
LNSYFFNRSQECPEQVLEIDNVGAGPVRGLVMALVVGGGCRLLVSSPWLRLVAGIVSRSAGLVEVVVFVPVWLRWEFSLDRKLNWFVPPVNRVV